MKESGIMDFNKDMGFGKGHKENIMKVSGNIHKQMAMALSNTKMETDIRVIGNHLLKVD